MKFAACQCDSGWNMDIFCQFWYIRLPSIFAVPYSQRWRSQAAPPCGQFRCLAGDGWRGTTWQQSRYGLVSFCFFRNPDSKSLYHCAPLRWYIGIQSMHFYLQYNVYLCRYIVYLFVDKKLCIYIYLYTVGFLLILAICLFRRIEHRVPWRNEKHSRSLRELFVQYSIM